MTLVNAWAFEWIATAMLRECRELVSRRMYGLKELPVQ